MKRYDERLKMGLCPQCGSKRDTRYIRCSKCNSYFKEYMRNHRNDNNGNTRNANKYRKRNRREGLCPTCGKVIDDNRYKRCSDCRILTRSYYHNNKAKVILGEKK